MVFREVYVGALPAYGRRVTWTLVRAGATAILRVEEQRSVGVVPHLDRTSLRPELWGPAARSEYVGVASAASAPLTLRLHRRFGAQEPAALELHCVRKTLAVHPDFATLVEGWVNSDDSMEPASWAPPRTERVVALHCEPPAEGWSFSDGLSFAPGKAATLKDVETSGVEWGFVNSDMVIQEGGYRWIPAFTLGH